MKENQLIKNGQSMTSLQIAEATGKRHCDVLRAIKNMEPAWETVRGRKFALTLITNEMPNGATRKDPVYELTKTECLYIATKFNDEARARLILRWEELENEKQSTTPKEAEKVTIYPPRTQSPISQQLNRNRKRKAGYNVPHTGEIA